jgi:hypothetical protein
MALEARTRALGAPRGPRAELFTGLDFGLLQDPTALSVVEMTEADEGGRRMRRYDVRQLKRWPLRTAYDEIIADVVMMFAGPPLAHTVLLPDETGVGVAVLQLLFKARPRARIIPITITGGQHARAVHDAGRGWTVPKRELASALQAALGTGRLRISPQLPLAKELAKELSTFRVKISIATGKESFEAWREKDKDDAVLATALPVWWGERWGKRPAIG